MCSIYKVNVIEIQHVIHVSRYLPIIDFQDISSNVIQTQGLYLTLLTCCQQFLMHNYH